MDGTDVEVVGKKAEWLPLGYDPEIYRPGKGNSRDIDVLFVGLLNSLYSARRRYLKTLEGSYLTRRYRCVLVGTTGTRVGDRIIRVPRGVDWLAKRLPERELGALVARSKICVNIHQDDGGMPVNPMFFAIPGAGACQVAEKRPYLSRWLTPFEHYIPADEDGLEDALVDLLEHDVRRNSVSRASHEIARNAHTYFHRIDMMLARLSRSNPHP
jgi:hypothetical protein